MPHVHGIQEIDLRGRIAFANAAVHKILRYGDRDLVGRSIYDLAASEADRARLCTYVTRVSAADRESGCKVLAVRAKDGELVDIEWDWSVRWDEHGRKSGIIAVVTELPAQRSGRKVSIDFHDFFTLFADHLPTCLFVKDDKSILKYVNNYMIEHFNAHRWIGQERGTLPSARRGGRGLGRRQTSPYGGAPFQGRVDSRQKRERRCFETCKFPIKRRGEPPLLGAISIDVTARMQGDEALRRDKDQLELRVLKRTKELTRANALLEAEITRRKRSEDAPSREAGERFRILYERAKQQEEHYLSLLNSSTDAIVDVRYAQACHLSQPRAH